MQLFVKIVQQVKQSHSLIVIAVVMESNEAACVPRMNNQHPSEVMGGSRIGGMSACVRACMCACGGGLLEPRIP